MAETRVRRPDGKVVTVRHPEGATREEILAFAKSSASQSTPPSDPLSGLPEGSALERAQDPTSGMSGGQKFLAGAGKALTDLGRGVGDITGLVSEEEIAESRRRDAPLMETGAGTAGNIAGNVAAFLPTAMIPGANTVTGGALTGAAVGALMPTTEDESRLGNMAIGGVTGGAVSGAVKGAGKVYGMGRNAIQPHFRPDLSAARALNAAAGNRRPAVLAALKGNTDDLATAGEAAAPAGSAEFSALQKIANRMRPSDDLARRSSQAGRRTERLAKALRTADLDDFKSARSAAADPLYESARRSTSSVDVAPVATKIDDILSTNRNRSALTSPLESIKKKLDSNTVTDLASLSDEISDMVSKKPPTGQPLPNTVVRKLLEVKETLDNQIARSSDDFAQARNVFAEKSKPVNQAELGRTLLEALDSPVRDLGGEMSQRYTAYASALRDAPKTIKKATGFNRGSSLSSIADPNQMSEINRVGSELVNRANFEQLARAGAQAAGDTLESVQPGQLPGILERNVVIANSILGRSGKAGTRKILEHLADNMDNPRATAEIMERVSPEMRAEIQAILNALRSGAVTSSATATARN